MKLQKTIKELAEGKISLEGFNEALAKISIDNMEDVNSEPNSTCTLELMFTYFAGPSTRRLGLASIGFNSILNKKEDIKNFDAARGLQANKLLMQQLKITTEEVKRLRSILNINDIKC